MAPEHRVPGVTFRDRIGTPLIGDAPKVMLLGSGELGREIAIEAMRLGAEVVALDRYANAPAMQVAHRHHVVAMTDAAALRALVHREAPDVLVPEIEQIATAELVRLEEEGWTVIPRAESARTTMDRERIRRLAAEKAHVRTSRYAFVESVEEARSAVQELGLPCVFKAMMSSSGHGMTVVRDPGTVEAAYREASEHGRVRSRRVMIEEFIPFDREVTMLALRHYDPQGRVVTTVMEPIAHVRPGTLYHESWQPEPFPPDVARSLDATASAVTDELGGVGIFGVECFVRGGTTYFSEVSPRPHDTGLVTLGSQWNSEFALHARAILGLPYTGPEPTTLAAAHVILASGSGWAPSFGGLTAALGSSGVRLFLFGKPEVYPDRRLGVAVARGRTIEEARLFAEKAAHAVEAAIEIRSPAAPGTAHP
ncbi:MAG TPA: formate-dependent phosphoribosylglycinamide formyltransferase [Thermoplasmata archaeon]|nr:formate-dependent phosphoribosylglycinamide formyltransferase [Thermoplasmata archaeon]